MNPPRQPPGKHPGPTTAEKAAHGPAQHNSRAEPGPAQHNSRAGPGPGRTTHRGSERNAPRTGREPARGDRPVQRRGRPASGTCTTGTAGSARGRGPPKEYAAIEQPLVIPLPQEPFGTGRLFTARSDHSSRTAAGTNRYPVPARLTGKPAPAVPHASHPVAHDTNTGAARHGQADS